MTPDERAELLQRSIDKCACGTPKKVFHEFCTPCQRRIDAERRRMRQWEVETFGRRNYVIVRDPDGLFRPGAEFTSAELIDMLGNGYVSPDMLVFSKYTRTSVKTAVRLGDVPKIAREAEKLTSAGVVVK